MKFKFFLQSMFLVYISFKSLASASEQELLTTGDIQKLWIKYSLSMLKRIK